MRTFFAALIFSISLIGIGSAQINGKAIGSASTWTDSLGYGVVAASDSVLILDTSFSNEWYRIFVKGNSNSPVDSIGIKAGAVRYTNSGVAVDTVWGSYSTLKDSSWSNANTIVNNTVGKDYTLFNPAIQLLKFSLLNHRGGLITRNVVITIQAVRK